MQRNATIRRRLRSAIRVARTRFSALAWFVSLTFATAIVVAPQTAAALEWTGGVGAWVNDHNVLNWIDGATPVYWTNNAAAVFGGTAGTVTVSNTGPDGGPVAVNGITFNTSGYEIGGDALTLGTNSIVANTGVTATIAAALGGTSGISLTGGGTLALSADNSASLLGNSTIGVGSTLSIAADNNLGAAATLTMANNATLKWTAATAYAPPAARLFSVATGDTATMDTSGQNLTLGAAAQLGGGGTLVRNGGDTILGNIGAVTAGTRIQQEAGTLYATASSGTVTGDITLKGGALAGGGGTLTYSGTVLVDTPLSGSNVVALNSGSSATTGRSITLSGKVSGTGALTLQTGASTNQTLTLSSNTNDIAGVWTVNPNTTLLAKSSTKSGKTLGTAEIILAGGALTINDNASTLSYGNNISVTANSTLTATKYDGSDNDRTITFGPLSVGAATLTVASTNSRFSFVFGDATLTGDATINATTAPSVTIASVGQTGGTRTLTKSGPNPLIITGNSTYSGITTVTGGALLLGSLGNGGTASGIGSLSNAAANIVLDGGGYGYNGATATATDRNFTVGVNGATIYASGAGALTYNGAPTYATVDVARTLGLSGTGTAANTFASAITDNGAGAVTLSKSGTGTWYLGTANSYSGGTIIAGGTLSVSALSSLGTGPVAPTPNSIRISGGTLAVTTGFTLDSNRGIGIGLTSGTSSGTATFDVAASQTLTLDGIIASAGNTGTTNKLAKKGSGLLVLGNAGNTFDAIDFNGGTVSFASIGALGRSDGPMGIPNSGESSTLEYTGSVPATINRPFSLGGQDKTFALVSNGTGSLSWTGTITNTQSTTGSNTVKAVYLSGPSNAANVFSGMLVDMSATNGVSIIKTGTGTWTLTGDNVYSGNTTAQTLVRSGTLVAGGDVRVEPAFRKTVAVVATTDVLTVTSNPWANGDKIVFDGSATPAGLQSGVVYYVFNKDTNGTDTFQVETAPGSNVAANITGDSTTCVANRPGGVFGSQTSAIILGDSGTANNAAALMIGGAFTIARPVTVANVANTGGYTLGGSTDNTSTYSGLITVNKDLTISQAATTGGNALNITGGITGLVTATTKTVTFAGPGKINVGANAIVNGTGTTAVAVTGGVVNFDVANTYTGNTTINGGTLNFNVEDAVQSGAVTYSSGTLNLAVPNAISGAAGLNVIGGSYTLNVANDYTGVTTVTAGTLTLSAPATLGAATANLTVVDGTLNLGGTSQTVGVVSITGAGTLTNGSLTGTSYAISNASGTATISANLNGTDITLTKTNAGTAVLSGSNGYTGATTVSGGVLQFNSLAAIGGSGATVTVNAGAAAAAGYAIDQNYLNRIAGASAGVVALGADSGQTLDFSAAGANLTAASLGAVGNFTYAGALTPNGATYRLGGGGGKLTLSSANALTGSGNEVHIINSGEVVVGNTNDYSGATRIYQGGTLKIGAANALPTATTLDFGNSGTTVGSLDLTEFSQTVAGLSVKSNTSNANTIAIGSGQTLTVNGPVAIGWDADIVTNLTVTGPGTLAVNNPGGIFQVGGATTNNRDNRATLDLSALTTFTADLGATGVLRVGDYNSGNGSANSSTLILANTSTVTAQALGVGVNGYDDPATQTLKLGSGVNTLNVDTVSVGSQLSSMTVRGNSAQPTGVVNFNTATGSLILKNRDGGRAEMKVGVTTSTGTTGANVVDLNDHNVDLLLSTLTVTDSTRTTATGTYANTFSFNTGTLDVTTLNMAKKSGSGAITFTTTVNVGGGTVNVGSGGITLLTQNSTAGVNNSALNINGGTVTMGGDIGIVLTLVGVHNATLNLAGGTLDMGGFSIGSGAAPVDTLIFASGVLKNVAEINGGAVGVTKTTSGTLLLNGVNTYTGLTDVQAGTLGGSGAIAGAVTVQNGATLNPGGAAPSTLTINNTLTFSSTANAVFDLVSLASYDKVVGVTTLTYGGTLQVNVGPTVEAGVYDLFGFTTASGSIAFTPPSLPAGYSWKDYGSGVYFNTSSGKVEIVGPPAGPVNATWTATAAGSWADGGNWSGGVPDGQGTMATFKGAGTGSVAVTVAGAQPTVTVGRILFNQAAGTASYTLSGAALTLDNTGNTTSPGIAKIEATAGVHEIASPVKTATAGTDLDVTTSNAGRLSLTGGIDNVATKTLTLSQTVAGPLTANALTVSSIANEGTLLVKQSGSDALGYEAIRVAAGINGAGDTTVGTTGTGATTATLITEHIRQDVLTINAGSKVKISATGGASSTSVVNVLNIANASGSFSWSSFGGDISPAATGGPVASGAAVPEPATWLLAVIAALAGLVAWRRRK